MYRIFTMEGLAAKAVASLSFTMVMVSLTAVLALVLGAVGLYAVLSYGVTQRTQEIGVRMALGAEAKAVRRMFVWQGTRVALLGVVPGRWRPARSPDTSRRCFSMWAAWTRWRSPECPP